MLDCILSFFCCTVYYFSLLDYLLSFFCWTVYYLSLLDYLLPFLCWPITPLDYLLPSSAGLFITFLCWTIYYLSSAGPLLPLLHWTIYYLSFAGLFITFHCWPIYYLSSAIITGTFPPRLLPVPFLHYIIFYPLFLNSLCFKLKNHQIEKSSLHDVKAIIDRIELRKCGVFNFGFIMATMCMM